MKTIYQDTIYKNTENGRYYTGEYLKNHFRIDPDAAAGNGYTEISYNTMEYREMQEELTGKTIRCNYARNRV